MNIIRSAVLGVVILAGPAAAEEMKFGFIDVERAEYQFEHEATALDLSATYGSDEHKVVAELDLEDSDGDLELLYARPYSAYFDIQLGLGLLRHDGHSVAGLVAAFEGLAPYRIEVDAATTLTEDGDVLLAIELERDFLLSPYWEIQPRLSLEAALSDADKLGIASGVHSAEIELRLRYLFNRKLMPYVGVSSQHRFGDTADSTADAHATSAVVGVSFWFN